MRQIIGAAALLIFIPSITQAECICVCMNGQNQPLCESTIDLRPICTPRLCPLEPPSLRPLTPPTLPPLGTKHCTQEMVFNDYTLRYEWQKVCW